MHFYGRGIDLDRKKACELYKKALSSEDISSVDSGQIVGVYLSLGRAYCEKFTDSELTKNEAINYLKKAFELGEYESIRFLSLCENEIDEDDINWVYQTASKHPDDAYCSFVLGMCYEFGKGTSKNFELAFKCYQKSAEKCDLWGMQYLAYAYFEGQGVAKNLPEGFKWELRAAESVPQAQFNVGVGYLQGNGVQQNVKEAEEWLKRASKNLYAPAADIRSKNNRVFWRRHYGCLIEDIAH